MSTQVGWGTYARAKLKLGKMADNDMGIKLWVLDFVAKYLF